MQCFWKVKASDKDGRESAWSRLATWSTGLLRPRAWTAQWISYKDKQPSTPIKPRAAPGAAGVTDSGKPLVDGAAVKVVRQEGD